MINFVLTVLLIFLVLLSAVLYVFVIHNQKIFDFIYDLI